MLPGRCRLRDPGTLHDSLMARLDRLAPVKEVAQIAACIGRDFAHELLASGRRGGRARGGADQLVEAELFPPGHRREATYTFKHALVQDAAYAPLLSKRRRLHARIASSSRSASRRLYSSPRAARAPLRPLQALFEKPSTAGERRRHLALARSAIAEAVAHLQRLIGLVSDLPEGEHRQRLETDLQLALGGAAIDAKGPASPGMWRRPIVAPRHLRA